MNYFFLFSILSTFFNFMGSLFYLYGSYKKHIISSPTYLFFSLLMIIDTLFSLQHFASFYLIMTYLNGIFTCIISLFFSLQNPFIFNKKDIFLIIFASFLLLLLHFYPTTVFLITNFYYLINYFIYLLKLYHKEVQEWYLPWFFWIFASIFLFLGLLNSNPITWIAPIINFICWGSVFYFSFVQQKSKKNIV